MAWHSMKSSRRFKHPNVTDGIESKILTNQSQISTPGLFPSSERRRARVKGTEAFSVSLSICVCLSLSVYLCVCLSLCLSVCVCVSLSLSLCLSFCLSVCVSLSVYLCVCVSLSLYIYVYIHQSVHLVFSLYQEIHLDRILSNTTQSKQPGPYLQIPLEWDQSQHTR